MFIQTAYFIRVERRQIKVDYEIDSLPLGVSYKERKRERGRQKQRERERERNRERKDEVRDGKSGGELRRRVSGVSCAEL